jgi:SpoVK/Ycf46/Vps4 family AAA+-type ATPase
MASSEPTDAIRVVNAVLTQVDRLKTLPNVLVVTTSNLSTVIDDAFLDRADIKQYIGPPTVAGVYAILKSCLDELVSKQILVTNEQLVPWKELCLCKNATSEALERVAESCVVWSLFTFNGSRV